MIEMCEHLLQCTGTEMQNYMVGTRVVEIYLSHNVLCYVICSISIFKVAKNP